MTLLLIFVAIAVLVLGFVVGMCVTAKRADEAMTEALKIQTCTRPAPHICKENGPCNGWPKYTYTEWYNSKKESQ